MALSHSLFYKRYHYQYYLRKSTINDAKMSQEEEDRQVKFAMSSLKVGDESDDRSKRKQRKKPPKLGEEVEGDLRVSSWGGLYDEMVDNQAVPEEGIYKKSHSIKHKAAKQMKKPPKLEEAKDFRVSSWGGLYDQMLDDVEAHAATPSSPPMPEEESHKKSASSKHRLASYQIGDVVDEERAEEDNSEKHRKSKHRSHHKKSHRHDHSEGKPDEENEKHHRRHDLDSSTTSEKSKSRRHRHTENHSLGTIEKTKSRRSKRTEEGDSMMSGENNHSEGETEEGDTRTDLTSSTTSEKSKSRRHRHAEIHSLATIEKSKSRRSKHSEEGDSMKLGEKTKSRRHRRVKVPLGEEDDELSKRIAEKLRERELEKKKSRRATLSALGGSNVSSPVCSDYEEVDEEVDADRRE
jgi:hypothetical protein